MKVSAVLLARTIALFDIAELNPNGSVYAPGLIPLLAKRFAFQTVPKRIDPEYESEDNKEKAKGIVFEHGYFDGQTVSNLTLYTDGIKLDLLSSTEDGKRILSETLNWLVEEAGITFSENMLKRWGFLSNLVIESDLELDTVNPALRILGDRVSRAVNARVGLELDYRPAGVTLNFERVNYDLSLAPFTIERRARTPFSEKKYYSSAPLETSDHIRFLEQFENDLVASR